MELREMKKGYFMLVRSFADYAEIFGNARSNWLEMVQNVSFSRVVVERFRADYENGGGKFVGRREYGNFDGRLMTDAEKVKVGASVSAACWLSLSSSACHMPIYISLVK